MPDGGVHACVELQKLRHDRTELFTRVVQPVLWLLVFGTIFNRIRAIPTGDVPYLDYLAPGILAQSALFIAIFYGIQIIWDRDAGILTKVWSHPRRAPRSCWPRRSRPACAALAPVVVLVPVAAAARRRPSPSNPLQVDRRRRGLMLGAGVLLLPVDGDRGLVAQTRDRLMGIGQAHDDAALLRVERAVPDRR